MNTQTTSIQLTLLFKTLNQLLNKLYTAYNVQYVLCKVYIECYFNKAIENTIFVKGLEGHYYFV